MNRQDALTIIKTFPETPGVYFFTRRSVIRDRLGFKSIKEIPTSSRLRDDRAREVLYIGKATSLRDRVKSYWANDIAVTRGPKILKMLLEFDAITFEKTDSVLEALLLESHLIKKYQPIYNTAAKDGKSNLYVVITKEDYPRILMVRGKDLLVSAATFDESKKFPYSIKETFGPFPYGYTLREAMKIIRRIFPYRDAKCVSCDEQRKKNPVPGTGGSEKFCKPCFNRQIGLCPGVCTGEISKEEYGETIQNIIHFFEGNKKAVIKNLEKRMKECAKQKRFEEAGVVKKQLFALTHIHDVSLIREETWKDKEPTGFRIESYDIAHMGGDNVVGVMTVVEDGFPAKGEYRKFKIKDDPGVNDTKALKEVLSRRLGHNEWRLPDLIVVDGGVAQKRALEKVIRDNSLKIPVVSVVKDLRHKPKEILGDKSFLVYEKEILLSNAEAHRFALGFHKILRHKNMFQ